MSLRAACKATYKVPTTEGQGPSRVAADYHDRWCLTQLQFSKACGNGMSSWAPCQGKHRIRIHFLDCRIRNSANYTIVNCSFCNKFKLQAAPSGRCLRNLPNSLPNSSSAASLSRACTQSVLGVRWDGLRNSLAQEDNSWWQLWIPALEDGARSKHTRQGKLLMAVKECTSWITSCVTHPSSLEPIYKKHSF